MLSNIVHSSIQISKFLKYYFIFSIGFGVYGFTRGYRAIQSQIKYDIEMKYNKKIIEKNPDEKTLLELKNKYSELAKKELNNELKTILITDKIQLGLIESTFYWIPIFNCLRLYALVKRIDIYLHEPKENYRKYEYREIFNVWWFNGTCYDII